MAAQRWRWRCARPPPPLQGLPQDPSSQRTPKDARRPCLGDARPHRNIEKTGELALLWDVWRTPRLRGPGSRRQGTRGTHQLPSTALADGGTSGPDQREDRARTGNMHSTAQCQRVQGRRQHMDKNLRAETGGARRFLVYLTTGYLVGNIPASNRLPNAKYLPGLTCSNSAFAGPSDPREKKVQRARAAFSWAGFYVARASRSAPP